MCPGRGSAHTGHPRTGRFATATRAAQWVHLACGHRFHVCCFVGAAATHVHDAAADGPAYAALACPVCMHAPGGVRSLDEAAPAFVAGYIDDPRHRQHHALALCQRAPSLEPRLTFDVPPPECPLPPVPPPPPPPPPMHRWCCLHRPDGSGTCGAAIAGTGQALLHFRQVHHHREYFEADGAPRDLSYYGLRVCTACRDVLPLGTDHDQCPAERIAVAAAAHATAVHAAC